MFGRTGAPHTNGAPFLTLSLTIANSNHSLNPNTRWRFNPFFNPSPSQHSVPARFPQCPRFQKTAEILVSKYVRLLPAWGSTGMLTCGWWQLCVRSQSGKKQGPSPIYFLNRAPLRQNSALLLSYCPSWLVTVVFHFCESCSDVCILYF